MLHIAFLTLLQWSSTARCFVTKVLIPNLSPARHALPPGALSCLELFGRTNALSGAGMDARAYVCALWPHIVFGSLSLDGSARVAVTVCICALWCGESDINLIKIKSSGARLLQGCTYINDNTVLL